MFALGLSLLKVTPTRVSSKMLSAFRVVLLCVTGSISLLEMLLAFDLFVALAH